MGCTKFQLKKIILRPFFAIFKKTFFFTNSSSWIYWKIGLGKRAISLVFLKLQTNPDTFWSCQSLYFSRDLKFLENKKAFAWYRVSPKTCEFSYEFFDEKLLKESILRFSFKNCFQMSNCLNSVVLKFGSGLRTFSASKSAFSIGWKTLFNDLQDIPWIRLYFMFAMGMLYIVW